MTRFDLRAPPDDRVELALAAAWVRFGPNWSSTSELLGAPSDGRRRGGLLALVAAEELDDLLANAVEVGAELDQHLGGDSLALAMSPSRMCSVPM
jgi:hypothetical protein